MRRGIETVPKDGKLVILEDDASGTYELAQWSTQEGDWVGENGKPIKIIPTHWHAMQRDADVVQEQCGLSGPPTSQARPILAFSSGSPQWPSAAPSVNVIASPLVKPPALDVVPMRSQDAQPAPRGKHAARRFALCSIAAAMIASSLIGMYFRAEVSAYVTQNAGEHDHLALGTIGAQFIKRAIQFSLLDSYQADTLVRDAALAQQTETGESNAQTAIWEAVQITQPMAPEPTQLVENERRRADLAENELNDFRRSIDRQSFERDRENAALVQAVAEARQELAANEEKYRRALAEERDRSAALASELATARRDVETQAAQSSKAGDETAQLKRAAETATAELQQVRDRAKTLESELVVARRDLETQAALSRKASDEAQKKATETLAAELQQARERTETLDSELAAARREVETQATLARKANEEATQLKQAAQTTSELEQALQQERERTKTLESKLATARQEVETQLGLSRAASEETAQLRQATKAAIERPQKPIGTEALVREPAMTRQDVEAQAKMSDRPRKSRSPSHEVGSARAELRERDRSVPPDDAEWRSVVASPPPERPANSQITQMQQADSVVSSKHPAAAEANVNLEAARLLARANALLGEGNISAARVVLEWAAETGSAQASFRLAETYDPLVLSTWRIYGTRGDATKARELYAKAYDGGVKAARDRSEALQTAGSEAK